MKYEASKTFRIIFVFQGVNNTFEAYPLAFKVTVYVIKLCNKFGVVSCYGNKEVCSVEFAMQYINLAFKLRDWLWL
jgi:hypothetical protein